MSDLQDQIERMGFDAVMAHNLSEIVRITRETTIEECAKLVEPKLPRPCDCERCYCGNRGDMEAVASWDTDAYNAKAIRALAAVKGQSTP